MKKFLVAALVLVSTAGFSQGFQLGLKAGANLNNYTGGNIENSATVNFMGGATFGFLLGDHFTIQPEVLLSAQGAKIKDIGGNDDKYTVTYLNVPVMAKFRFTGGFYVEAGPQVGFKINENVPDQTIDNFAKSLDLSLAAGLGYHSPIGLGLGARYNAGLSKVGDFDGNNVDPDFKNSVLQVFVFYTLFNNKK